MRFLAILLALLLPVTAFSSESPILWNASCASGAFNAAEHSCLVTGGGASVCGDLSNAAASCSVDATNASNIGTGTLADARLSSNVNLLNGAQTITAAKVHSTAGAASTPALKLTGAPYAGGTTTTNKPQWLMEWGSPTSNNWDATASGGTALGINGVSGFAGSLVDAQVDGASMFKVSAAGVVTVNGATPIYGAGVATFTMKGTPGNDVAFALKAANGNGPAIFDLSQAGYLYIQTSNQNILSTDASGHVGLAAGAANGPTNLDTVNIASPTGQTTHNTLGLSIIGSQTGDPLVVWSGTTKLVRVESTGKADVLGLSNAGHETSTQAGTTTATVDAHAGTGATCVVAHATDVAGEITLVTTAIGPASGSECAVGFASAYGTAPICVIWPANAAAILNAVVVGFYVTASTSALTINAANSDVTGGTYKLNYRCTETQ